MQMSVKRWWNDTDRGEWSVGGMILTGESEIGRASCRERVYRSGVFEGGGG
jgi:hypothetical protein